MIPGLLRVDDLRYLLGVANTGRLVAAADALGVDQGAVALADESFSLPRSLPDPT